MTPSRILSLFDPMLPYETVCMCLSAYLGDKEDQSASNPLISPAAASDDILSKFPSTLLVAAQVTRGGVCVGGNSSTSVLTHFVSKLDPLLDDSSLMARRLHALGVPVSFGMGLLKS